MNHLRHLRLKFLLVLPYEIAVPISQLEKTRICYSYTDYNLFLTSYLVISLSIVNELKCALTAATHCIKQRLKISTSHKDLFLCLDANREQSVKE